MPRPGALLGHLLLQGPAACLCPFPLTGPSGVGCLASAVTLTLAQEDGRGVAVAAVQWVGAG